MFQRPLLPQKPLVSLIEKTFIVTLCLPMTLYAQDTVPNADQPEAEIANVVVTAPTRLLPAGIVNRKASVGILGNLDYMNNPYNVISYGRTAIQNQQARSVGGFINKYDASINVLGSDTYAVDVMTVRGIFVSPMGTSVNGLAGMAGYHKIPSNGIEAIQVTKGPSAMLKGVSLSNSVGGDVNLTTKRAGNEPLNEIGLSFLARNRLGGTLDIGRRFGPEQEWGVRFNSEYREGDGMRQKQEEKTTLNALALDYRSDRFRASIDAMVNNANASANRGVLMSDATQGVASINGQLPPAPNGKINFDQSWIKQKSRDRMIMGRLEFDVTDDLMAYGTLGYSTNFLAAPNIGNWFITKPLDPNAIFGSFSPAALSNFKTKRKTVSSEIGANGTFNWGQIQHNWGISGTLSQYKENVGSSFYTLPDDCKGSTITNVTNCEFDVNSNTPFHIIDNRIRGRLASIAVADTITFWDGKLQTTLGVRQQQIKNKSYSNGTTTDRSQTATTPTIGIVFKPVNNLSIYGNYVEALAPGDAAPFNATNAGEVMSPYKTKQKELGIKKDFGSWLASAAVFEIERASGLIDHDTLVFSSDGKRRNRGVELSFSGEPLSGLRLSSSTAWIKSKRINYDPNSFSGSDVFPAPKFSSKLNLEWDIPNARQLTLLGSVIHTGKTTVDGYDFYTGQTVPTKVPAWTRVDLGVVGKFNNLLGKETTLQLTLENAFNKRYWSVGDFNDTNVTVLDHATSRALLLTLKTKL
ncbi:MAG: TonB-dependent receptor [Neisseriaceae bacterium]|nr:TonB-dependent receptor [Neisseriaceae bacterium]